jgi:UDP-N-acetylmuramoyl-L-alanyl-D-glutamate--2,6-diaminopimelate ligase
MPQRDLATRADSHDLPPDHPQYKLQAFMRNVRYGFPAEKLKLIGVTGTNGKTSVCYYTTQILEEAGLKAGMSTTFGVNVGGQCLATRLPGRCQCYLDQMVKAGCEYAVLEATSFVLAHNRYYGFRFDAAAFTNLTPDHLQFHGTMEQYRLAKEKLFASVTGTAVVNAEDPAARHFLKYDAGQKLTFGILDDTGTGSMPIRPQVTASSLQYSSGRTSFLLSTPHGRASVSIPLFGRHTVANALAAVAICLSQGVPFDSITSTLSRLRPPEGRLQRVELGQPFSIIVDYAHNEDGLRQTYRAVRLMTSGRLIAVLGADGHRHGGKRIVTGALAAQYADYVILTNVNPRTTDPMSIINELAAGVAHGRRGCHERDGGEGTWWWRIEDRREAIAKALALARKGDTVLLTGKGPERFITIGDWRNQIPFNDAEVVQELLSEGVHRRSI